MGPGALHSPGSWQAEEGRKGLLEARGGWGRRQQVHRHREAGEGGPSLVCLWLAG